MNKLVVVGLSGGVDSAVAALILKRKGYEVIGAFMKNFSETKNKLTGECLWVEEKKSAQRIAAKLNIPFVVFDFEKEYTESVVKPMIHGYKIGKTPDPDSLCNTVVKFPLFWREAKKIGADYIAMGHYVRKRKHGRKFSLLRGKDGSKDQSYFLYGLTQEDLRHTLFPIGDLTKSEVRNIAKRFGFHNYSKKSTSGVCFIGNIDFKEFLGKHIKPKKGKVVLSSGEIIGKHNGTSYFTIGERIGPSKGVEFKNSEISGKKMYVVRKDSRRNVLMVAPQGDKSLLMNKFVVRNVNWISSQVRGSVSVRIRHLGDLIRAKISLRGKAVFVHLSKHISGLAEGQSAVFYRGQIVLGGGEIFYK